MIYKKKIEIGVLNTLQILILFLMIFPLIWLIITSIKPRLIVFAWPPVWIFKPTLDNYIKVLQEGPFLESLVHSSIVAIGTSIFSIFFAIPGAYALGRLNFKGKQFISLWTLVVRMSPPVAFILALYMWLRALNLIDTYMGLIFVYQITTLPLSLWILRSFFQQIPVEIEEAAKIDGCSNLNMLFMVDLPLVVPGVITAAILSFIMAWNEFFFALILTGNDTRTLPVTIQSFVCSTGIEWGSLAAASIIVTAPVLIFAIMVRKGFIQGLTSGAIK
jgi:multiple sugar transport system permease protein